MDDESKHPNAEMPTEAEFAEIEERLFERIRVAHRRQVVRHRLVAVAAVLVIGGAGVAAGTTASSQQQSRSAYCYGGSSTSSRLAQLALTDQSTRGSDSAKGATPKAVANAIALCAVAWRSGFFSSSSGSGPVSVPQLEACVRDDLTIAVFRAPKVSRSATDFCNSLGLSAP